MSIEKQPFRKYSLEENQIDIVTLRLNVEERKQLEEDKQIIEQAVKRTIAEYGEALKRLGAE